MPEYVKVAQASEIEPNHGKLVEVQGKKIALFNVDGKFHAIDNTCTHRGGPLSEGEWTTVHRRPFRLWFWLRRCVHMNQRRRQAERCRNRFAAEQDETR